jgi:diguanylate cyclase (GGDEF)-like protein
MSLIKQIWLTIVALLLLAFIGSLFIGVTTSRHYIQEESLIQNADNANALALTMSQLEKDPAIIELLMAAQYDTGRYRLIELRAPDGDIIERRETLEEQIDGAPSWFVDLVRFDVPPGRAVVRDGGEQYGTLTLQSQHGFAYRSLWQSALALTGWFALAGVISLLLGWWIVRTIRSPLTMVIEQARDISVRRFTTSKEPRTRELREVVKAMNQLSLAVHEMLGKESEKLDVLRRRLQHDEVTGVLDRKTFLGQLQLHLASDDFRASGTLAMVRLARLGEISDRLGHTATDVLLKALTQTLEQLGRVRGGGLVGRLKGSDLVLLLPGSDSEVIAKELSQRLERLREEETAVELGLASALVDYAQGDRMSELFASLDGALASAEAMGGNGQVIAQGVMRDPLYTRHADWRAALHQALEVGVYLGHYPVLDEKGRLLHMECPSRLRLKGEWRSAGVFLPWISRLELDGQLDMEVVRAGLKQITQSRRPVAINLSPASIRDSRFVMDLRGLLASRKEEARNLWLELPVAMAIHDLASFRSLCRELNPLGCHLGLEHVGTEFTRIADLHDLGLAYMKIDNSLVGSVDTSPEQQSILRGMVTLCHSMDILAIAEGVNNQREARVLFELGMDGVTGPGVRQHERPT